MSKIINVLTISTLLLSVVTLHGQNFRVINNAKTIILTGSIEERIKAYNQLGWQYRKLYPDSSIYYLNAALNLIEDSGDNMPLPETYNFLGVAYLYKGDYLNSFDYHDKAKSLAFQNDDSLQYAHALNSLGRLYEGTAAYDKAIEYYNEALTVFELLNDRIGLAYIYSSLATFHQSQQNFDKAEELSKKALEIRKNEKLWAGVAFSYLELAKIYTDSGNDNLALETLQKAQQFSDSVQANMVLKAEINTEISSQLRKRKRYNEAEELMQVAIRIAEGIENQNLFMKVYNEVGKLNYDLKQYNKSILYLKKVIVSAEKSAFWKELKEAYLQLANNYEQLNDIAMAYNYYKKYTAIEKQFLDTEKARLVQQHESRIALENRARENDLLRLEQLKNQALIAEQKLRNLGLFGITLLLFLVLIMLWINGLKRQKANRLLTEQKNKLAEINLQKDTLMNILAHDLKAPFNRIIGLVELIKSDKTNTTEYVGMIQEASQSGVGLIKNILEINRLESVEVKENIASIDISKVLLQKANHYTEEASHKNMTVISELNLPNNFVTNQLYVERIIENLLSNAIKYGHKNTEVYLEAFVENDNLKITVTDQGPGFTEVDKAHLYSKFKTLSAKPTGGEVSNGLGLSLVKTLVDKLNGKITLITEVGKGSTFTVLLPQMS